MMIRDFRLDGFGVFNNVEVTGLSSGLNVFYGGNEAGKSTLLAFFRAMLFGFPGKVKEKQGITAPEPFRGGRHGGSLVLFHPESGLVRLSRFKGKGGNKAELVFADGTRGDDIELNRLLSGVTAPLFNNVYAFSLRELAEFDNLTDEAVRGALFGASFGAGMHTFADAFKKLGNVKEELFKSGGSKPAINQELSALSEIRKKIAKALSDQGRYEEVGRELSDSEKTAEELAFLCKELNRERQGLENTSKLWDDWVVFRETTGRLEALGEGHSGFPAKGLERLERLIQLADKEKTDRAGCLAEKEDHEALGKALVIDPRLLENEESVERLNERLAAFSENLRELSERKRRIEELLAEADRICRELGPGWTRERLGKADCSVFVKQGLDRKAKDLLDSERAAENAGELLGLHSGAASEAEAEEARAVENAALFADDTVVDYADIAEARKNLRLCRDLEAEARGLEKDADFAEIRVKEREGGATPLWAVFAAVIAGFALAALSFRYAGAPLGAGLVLVSLAVGGLMFLSRKKRLKLLAEAGDLAENARRAWRDALARLHDLAGQSGFSGNDWDGMAEALDRRERERTERESRRQAALAALKKAEEAARLARNRLDEARTALEKAGAAHDEKLAAWKEGLSSLGLPSDLSPRTAFDAFGVMENGARLVRELETAVSEAGEIENRISGFRAEAARVLSVCGRETGPDQDLDAAVRLLHADLRKNMEARAELARISGLAASLDRRISAHDKELARLGGEMADLLESAGARDAGHFMELGARAEEYSRLAAEKESAARNLLKISGENDLGSLCARLSALDRRTVAEKLDDAGERLEKTERDLESVRRKAADARSLLETLAGDSFLADLRMEEGAALERLRVLGLQWSRRALALELLALARRRFEESERPAVIKEAESLFAKITDGAYPRLLTPAGELEIEAETPGGVRRKTSDLSRGTAEQLYLCLRLAFARAGAARHGGIPLVMDDVFVNFDYERAQRAALVLSDVARSMQVLYFTCHAHTFEMFRQAAPDAGFFRLEGGYMEKVPPF